MPTVTLEDAQARLPELIDALGPGESLVITRGETPVARLVGGPFAPAPRPLGLARGQGWVAEDFDDPLPPDVLAGFEGGAE